MYLVEGGEREQTALGQPGLWFSVEVGLHQLCWRGSLTCWLPSCIDSESRVRKTGLLWQACVSAMSTFLRV